MQNVMPMLANKDFVDDTAEKNFKVIYQFDVETPEEEINEFKKALDEAVKEVTYFNLYTSKDFYDGKKLFIVVHGLKSVEGALGFAEILEENEQTISKEYFGISSKNYQTIQIHKNLDEYLKSQQ